jgi:hypothetical protein
MTVDLVLAITVVAIIVMLYALWMVITLKKNIPGGMVGKYWNFLLALVVLFAGGYIAMPFLGNLDVGLLRMAVALIFLFGAVYVVVTITLINKVIKALSE